MVGPLSGFTIGVTADRRSDEQISLLSGRGATCVHGPTIRTHPLRPEGELSDSLQQLVAQRPDFVVLTTGIGVRGMLEAAEALRLGREVAEVLSGSRVFVRGPKAHGAAVTGEIDVEWSSGHATSAEVVDRLAREVAAGDRVAVQIDGALDQPLLDSISDLGVTVVPVPVYRWSIPEDTTAAESLIRAVVGRRVDAVTFTARPALANFFEIADRIDLRDDTRDALNTSVKTFSIGAVCSTAATEAGVTDPIQPERPRLGGLITRITREFESSASAVDIGGMTVRIQGRMVFIDGEEPSMLTGREREVLDVLIERPGVVHSKASLLHRIWGAGESDAHVVEVTIGRLRKRLGAAGVGIETVFRRGYRASPT